MNKYRIAFVVAVPGSAHSFLKNHFERLTVKYDVNLVANFANEGQKQEFEEMGVTCHHVPILRSISIGRDIKALFCLISLFRRERFDSVHSVTPKAGLLTSVAAWVAGVKIRIHIFTGQVWATRKGVMRSMLKMMDKIITLFDNHILVDGESQRQFLINEDVVKEKNSQVLADGSICGVKLENFNVSETVRREERAKFSFKDDDVVFVFMGRLNHDKGIEELYEAFDRLAKDSPNAKLILYGSDEEGYDAKAGDYKNIIRQQNFFYPGHTKKPYDALQGCDVFVLPTWREGFGSSVIEAQALGLPVITTDAYGVCDASVEGKTGLRCHVGDADGLYYCMKTYYNSPELRREHGRAGYDRARALFDSKRVCDAWSDYYDSIFKQ